MKGHNSLDFLPLMYGELISQFAKIFANISQAFLQYTGDCKAENELGSLSQQIDIANLTLDNGRMSLEPLEHCSFFILLNVNSRLEGSAWLSMNRNIDIPSRFHPPIKSEFNYWNHRLPLMLLIPDYSRFQALNFQLFHNHISAWRALYPLKLKH